MHGTYLPVVRTHPDRNFPAVFRSQVSFLQSGSDEKFRGGLMHCDTAGDGRRPKDFCTVSEKQKMVEAGGVGILSPADST